MKFWKSYFGLYRDKSFLWFNIIYYTVIFGLVAYFNIYILPFTILGSMVSDPLFYWVRQYNGGNNDSKNSP